MTSRRTAWTLVAVLALAAPLSGCGLHGKPKVERKTRTAKASGTPAAPAISATFEAAAATEEPEPDTVISPGIVEPWGSQVELSPQEPGWIARIVVKEGDVVEPGQLLAVLEGAAQRHSVELAKADLAEVLAILARIETGATPEELREAKADHDAAAARRDFARSAAARTTLLHVDGAVPDAEADRAAADAQAQTALAERAEARLQEMKRGARAEDRSAARARVAAARARLQLAEANLARRRIVAPSAGTVLLSRFHAGEFHGPGAGALFVLGDVSRLQVRLEVDEIDANEVRRGAPCALYSDGGVRLAEGTVVRLAPKMGRRALAIESPTARADVRVREVFVEISATSRLIPGQRVWGHTSRAAAARDSDRRSSKEG